MRILMTGAAPWCNGSYGKPMRYVAPRLHAQGHQVAIACFYGLMGAVLDIDVMGAPVRLYPMVRDIRLNDIISHHAKDWEADCVISFADVWPLERWGYPQEFVWLAWMPVDTDPIHAGITNALEGCYTPMCYSKWGRDLLIESGWPTARYVPLGVDLDIYKPMSRTMARASLGLPEDGFIAGMVAANASLPPRKAFPEVLQAWKRYLAAGGTGTLYLHTTITPSRNQGFDFMTALQQLQLDWSTLDDPEPERKAKATVLFPSQYRVWCHAIEDNEIARTYAAMDVFLNPSYAEGFGLPILEAQACGVPVVTTAFSSMPEITFSGMCLPPVQEAWEPLGGWRAVPPVAGIVDALWWARDSSEGPKARQYHAEKARGGAENYTWDNAIEHLAPILEELQ